MRDETDMVKDVDRANKAASILNHPLFIQTMAFLKAETLDKFESLKFEQTAEMQECNQMLKAIDSFESNFNYYVTTGKSAITELEKINEFNKSINK